MADLIPLAQARCVPRKGSDHKLGEARLAELLPQVPGWELSEGGQALTRTFRFKDYYATMAFVNALAGLPTARTTIRTWACTTTALWCAFPPTMWAA